MKKHFKNIEMLYGDAYVQIPNSLFRKLSKAIKVDGKANIRQISFAYSYLITASFLYKYAHYVDLDNKTYMQNGDIKELLGYSRKTKTINRIISKDGVLKTEGLINVTRDYPISVDYNYEEEINGFGVREFTTISMVDKDYCNYEAIKSIVKNRNYEIGEPTFLFDSDSGTGTLYNYDNTHKVTLKEFMKLVYNKEEDNIDFLLYFFFKSKCFGLKRNAKAIALHKITSELGISSESFYTYLDKMKIKKRVRVDHKKWVGGKIKKGGEMQPNEYLFRVIK